MVDGRVTILSELLLEILSYFYYSRSMVKPNGKTDSSQSSGFFLFVCLIGLGGWNCVFLNFSESLSFTTYYCYLFKEVSY